MTCTFVKIGDATAIVCSRGARPIICVACGKKGRRLCDWKMGGGKTCDKPLCDVCAFAPAPKKDLCPNHAKTYKEWLAKQAPQPLELKP